MNATPTSRKRPKTSKRKTTTGGWKKPTTVVEYNAMNTMLAAGLREDLSPQAVAAVAAYLQPVRTMDPDIVRQVRWFRELLTDLVGGEDAMNRLCEEVGL